MSHVRQDIRYANPCRILKRIADGDFIHGHQEKNSRESSIVKLVKFRSRSGPVQNGNVPNVQQSSHVSLKAHVPCANRLANRVI